MANVIVTPRQLGKNSNTGNAGASAAPVPPPPGPGYLPPSPAARSGLISQPLSPAVAVLLANSLEGGTSGTAVTTGNSGGASGNAFDAVNIVTGGTVAFSNAHSAHGGLSCLVSTGTTTTSGSYVEWSSSLGTVTTHFGRAYVYMTSAPGSSDAFIQFQSTAGWAGGIQLTTTKTLLIQDQAFGTVHTMASTLPLGTWFRLEWQLASSATAGGIVLSYYPSLDSVTPAESYTSPATQNFGPNCDAVLFGWTGGHVSQPATYIDDIGLSTAGFLGPAAGTAPQEGPPRPPPRPAHRAALGARGLCAAGVLAAGLAAQAPAPVPPGPRPVITHPAPHRAAWRSVTGQAYAAVAAPRQRPPQPRTPAPHAALWRRQAAAAQQPQGPSRLPLPLRRPGPHRAITGGVRGLQPATVTGVAVPPPGWHPQPRAAAAHRVTWRAAAGLPPPQAVTTPPPRQLPQIPRKGIPRALWRARAAAPRLSTLPVPHPAAIPRQAPHRVIWRSIAGPQPVTAVPVPPPSWRPQPRTAAPHRIAWRLVTGQPPAAGAAVRAPKLIPQPRHLPAARGTWRRVTGTGNAPPPLFTIGALTASDTAGAALTAAAAAGALTAATAPQGALTAGTQAAGGPS